MKNVGDFCWVRKKVRNVWGFLLGREICLYIYQKCFGIFVGLRNMFTPTPPNSFITHHKTENKEGSLFIC